MSRPWAVVGRVARVGLFRGIATNSSAGGACPLQPPFDRFDILVGYSITCGLWHEESRLTDDFWQPRIWIASHLLYNERCPGARPKLHEMRPIRQTAGQLFLVTLIAVALEACNVSAADRTPSPTPEAAGTALGPSGCPNPNLWRLHLLQSGGFAGVSRTLELSSDGALIASDRNRTVELSGALEAAEIKSISDLLAAACPFRGEPRPEICFDCFEYSLQAEVDGVRFEFQANDMGLDDSPSGALIAALRGFLEEALTGPLQP